MIDKYSEFTPLEREIKPQKHLVEWRKGGYLTKLEVFMEKRNLEMIQGNLNESK